MIGYIVVVPLVELLYGSEDEEEDYEYSRDITTKSATPKRDAMETLRDRYAHGELTEEQFERKLDALLSTESLEDAEEWVLSSELSDDEEDIAQKVFEERLKEEKEVRHK